VRELVIPIVVGVAIAFAWMAVWALALHASGIPVLMRTPEDIASRKQRIIKMGKFRYILIFGLLGYGFAFGLGISIALMMSRGRYDWVYGATMFGAISLVGGLMNGIRAWNHLFSVQTPFPPDYPVSK
jgi:hypothetical protein